MTYETRRNTEKESKTRLVNLFSASADVLIVRVYVKHNLSKMSSAIT